MCHDGDVINWQPTPLLTKHGALIRGFCSCLWRCMMHHTASIQELVGYKWVQTFKSLLTFTVRSRSMETLNSTVTGWLVGLGVWFSLRVREVPGSNPGRALWNLLGGKVEALQIKSVKFVSNFWLKCVWNFDKTSGLVRDLNPGPLAPKARIIPLDHWAL